MKRQKKEEWVTKDRKHRNDMGDFIQPYQYVSGLTLQSVEWQST